MISVELSVMSTLLLQALINGFLLGGIYVLVSVGLSLAFGVMHLINVAQGDCVMLGAFIAYWIYVFTGIEPILVSPLAFFLFFVVGYLVQKFLVASVMESPALMNLVLFFGLSILFANAALLVWSPYGRIVTTGLSGAHIAVGGLKIPIIRFLAFFIAVGGTIGLFLFLQRTRLGLAIMASSEIIGDREAARLMGIDLEQIHQITLGLSFGTAAMAGALISAIAAINPMMGLIYTLFAFFITVLGGMGYLPGALVGGIVLGVAQSLIITYWRTDAVFFILFFLLYVILLIRPKGIFGRGVI